MSGSLIDTNVLLDIATADPNWLTWSQEQVRVAASRGAVHINPIIYAELAPAFASREALDRWLDPALFHRAAAIRSRLVRSAGLRSLSQGRRVTECAFARFLHRCPCASRRADDGDARRGAVSHVLSDGASHRTLTDTCLARYLLTR